MKNKIISVLNFPYANRLEIRVSRGESFNKPITQVNIYSARYDELEKVRRLAKLSAKMQELVLLSMINNNFRVANPLR